VRTCLVAGTEDIVQFHVPGVYIELNRPYSRVENAVSADATVRGVVGLTAH